MLSRWIIFVGLLIHVHGQNLLMEEIQRLYLKSGIPFRENSFLKDLPIESEYDFIVVGSGPGGATVANRLSEIPEWNVLLLEKGPENNIYSDIPIINPITILGNFSKLYPVEKTSNACTGLRDEICLWPAGEVLGGASVINAMVYTRGHPTDFDEWAQEGNNGWSYKDILPYFLKSEKMTINHLTNSKYHSTQGNVQIEYPYSTKLGERFLRAGKEAGYNIIDYNNPNTMVGVSKTQVAMKGGRRVSSASAYLMPVRFRPNLHIAKSTPVTKILIDPETKRATGVIFSRRGRLRKVLARKEVIISAGAFNSPKLLMLSGIGHREHLEKLKIPVIQDLPVGDNLQEHLGTPTLNFFINSSESVLFPRLIMRSPVYFIQWLNGQKNIFSNNGAEALGYIKTPYAKNKADIELIFLPLTPGSDAGAMLRKTISIDDNIWNKLWGNYYFREGFTICPMIMYPKSRGTIRLRSKNYEDPPIIDGNFFSDPIDVKVITAGVREAIRLTKTKPFQEIGATQHTVKVDNCKQHEFNSDEYWDCAIRSLPIQWHHQSGTCKMGPDPANSVVDPRLKVHGIQGLRVIDASIMPHLPGPHSMAPTYMIGEKGADLIKEDWGVLDKDQTNSSNG